MATMPIDSRRSLWPTKIPNPFHDDDDDDDSISINPDIISLIDMLKTDPKLHRRVIHDEKLDIELNALRCHLLSMGESLVVTERMVDRSPDLISVISHIYLFSWRVSYLTGVYGEGSFLPLETLMNLLKATGDVYSDKEAMWEDIERLLMDIGETVLRIRNKIEDFKASYEETGEGPRDVITYIQ